MKGFLIFCVGTILLMIALQYCDSKQDPYNEGSHWDYLIICEDGYKYKVLSRNRGTIPCKNSDGTFLKCNQKRY